MDLLIRKKPDVEIDFLADTNILINLLEGDERLESYTSKLLAISFITEVELLGLPGMTSQQIKICKSLLNDCLFMTYSNDIKELAIHLKQKQKIALPDAMITASGIHHNLPILTFDKRFFKDSGIQLILLK